MDGRDREAQGSEAILDAARSAADEYRLWEEERNAEAWADAAADAAAEEAYQGFKEALRDEIREELMRELKLGRPRRTERDARIVAFARTTLRQFDHKRMVGLAAKHFKMQPENVRRILRSAGIRKNGI